MGFVHTDLEGKEEKATYSEGEVVVIGVALTQTAAGVLAPREHRPKVVDHRKVVHAAVDTHCLECDEGGLMNAD